MSLTFLTPLYRALNTIMIGLNDTDSIVNSIVNTIVSFGFPGKQMPKWNEMCKVFTGKDPYREAAISRGSLKFETKV